MPAPRPRATTKPRATRALLEPVVVSDMEALDQAIEEFISAHSQAPDSVRNNAKRWRWWEVYCAELGVDPLAAPMSAFEGLWKQRTQDGTPFSPGYVQSIVTAVLDKYAKAGLTAAHKQPENRALWTQLIKSAKKKYAERMEASGDEDGDAGEGALPLLRDDAVRLLSSRPLTTPYSRALRAGLLMMLDSQLTAIDVERMCAADITVADDGTVTVPGATFACDHRERGRGVAWDCTACAIVEVAAAAAGDRLLAAGPKFWAAHLRKANVYAALDGLMPLVTVKPLNLTSRPSPVLRVRDDLSPWALAGVRRAVVLSALDQGLRWVRARAWAGITWTCGFRMGSDLDTLPRSEARPDPDDRGWSIRLGASKGDQGGSQIVVRPFSWPADGQELSVASMLAEYACVRDAFLGREGALFPPMTSNGFAPEARPTLKQAARAATVDVRMLAELAGVAPVYTSYSLRHGYATQAALDGWDLEEIQAGMRHLQMSTTKGYAAERDGQAISAKFIGKLEGEA